MRVATRITTLAAALAFALPFAGADAASLVYRGTLQDGGKPAEGQYDIQLTLYSAATGGKAIAAPVTLYGVPVHDGAFSTEVDFGPAATSAGNVYVAAAVAPQGSSDFVALDARTEASLDAPASTCNGTWALDGNSSNPSGSFLGNVDNQPLVFRVNNGIVGDLSSSTDSNVPDAPNVVFGIGGAIGAGNTIAGGGRPDPYCGISGTMDCNNSIIANYGTIGGGRGNGVAGYAATIPGGGDNLATANFSFAAGHNAFADTDGSFVWSDDSVQQQFGNNTHQNNAFLVRATGMVEFATATDANGIVTAGVKLAHGSGSWSNVSDRNLKTAIAGIDPAHVLDGVLKMPISSWQYIAQSADVRHIGPMAQDFFAAFHLGEDDRHITDIDEGGVAFAAIQGLNEKLETENATMQKEIADLHAEVDSLANRGK
jgi:hypothetical protein